MCSNRALADTVDCYMDELVECFEDFVKKSLIVMSVGIAAVVGMFIYLLKVVTDRSPTPNIIAEEALSARNQIRNMNTDDIKNGERFRNNIPQQKALYRENEQSVRSSYKMRSAGVNTASAPLTKKMSFDVKDHRDIGVSSRSKLRCCERTNSYNYIPCRVPEPCTSPSSRSVHAIRSNRYKPLIESAPICPAGVSRQSSCCSICCDDVLL